jgi:hypothetical protein
MISAKSEYSKGYHVCMLCLTDDEKMHIVCKNCSGPEIQERSEKLVRKQMRERPGDQRRSGGGISSIKTDPSAWMGEDSDAD